MPEQPPQPPTAPTADGPIDKAFLYGKFQAGEDRRARLYERAAHKALDIADDEMNVNTRVYRQGVGTAGVLAIAASVGLPATIAAAALAWFAMQPTEPAETADTDSALYLLDSPPERNDTP